MRDTFAPALLRRIATPRKVAIVRASRIGDFICATPALRALRAAVPEAEIALIGLPFVSELVERSPHLDRFVPFPGFPGMAEQFFEARKLSGFLSAMQDERFDLAIQMHGSGVHSNPFTLLLVARHTAGFIRPGDGPGRFDAAFPMPSSGHEIRRLLKLVEFLGAKALGEEPEFPLLERDLAEAASGLRHADPPLIGIHPGARDAIKRWPPDRFAIAAKELRRRHGGTVVLLGNVDEREVAKEIVASVGEGCLDLVGRTSLGTLGAVIDRLDVLVSNDSGPAHIASALGTPTVTIFGGTSPVQWGSLAGGRTRKLAHDVPCRPCELPACPIGYVCLVGTEVQEVVGVAGEIIRVGVHG